MEKRSALIWPIRDSAVTLNSILTNAHRISDLGLGLIDNGLADPVWAQDITLQSHTHDNIYLSVGSVPVNLIYDIGVPASYTLNGLWLPDYDDTAYNGLVKWPNLDSRSMLVLMI